MPKTNKEVLSENLAYYMAIKDVDRYNLCEALGLKYSTVSEWLSAKKYPRIDKIELLANYFDIEKADLIEDKSKKHPHKRERRESVSPEEIKKELEKQITILSKLSEKEDLTVRERLDIALTIKDIAIWIK